MRPSPPPPSLARVSVMKRQSKTRQVDRRNRQTSDWKGAVVIILVAGTILALLLLLLG